MDPFEKISQYLDSFDVSDENYDYANYIRQKLADYPSLAPEESVSAGSQTGDKDYEEQGELASTDKAQQNLEGSLMEPSFKDLEKAVQIEENKNPKLAEINYIRNFLDRLKR